MQAPAKSGSAYYNHKQTHSIVLLAVYDANYKFIMVDIGAPGRRSDGGIFKESEMGQRFYSNSMNLPPPTKIGLNGPTIKFYMDGDEAFALTDFMMRPYPRRTNLTLEKEVSNYRLSRARRMIECSFGILVRRFNIFQGPMTVNVRTAKKIVNAAVCLHNFILDDEKCFINDYENANGLNVTEGYQKSLQDNQQNSSQNALQMRQDLTDFFMGEGAVHWQWEKVKNKDY